jgi:hypothetical protein
MEQAWQLFMEGKIEQAKKLVEPNFSLETCTDYHLLNLMGYIYLEEKNYNDSLKIYQRYIDLARSKNDLENEHIGYHQLAMVYRDLGEFQKALLYINQEMEIIQNNFPNDALKLSINYYEQGFLHLKLGELEYAENHMQKSLDFALKTDDFIAQACAYRGMGEIYLAQESDKAQDYFYQSIQLFEKAKDKIGADEVRTLLENKK